jgi:hypothetical protein
VRLGESPLKQALNRNPLSFYSHLSSFQHLLFFVGDFILCGGAIYLLCEGGAFLFAMFSLCEGLKEVAVLLCEGGMSNC